MNTTQPTSSTSYASSIVSPPACTWFAHCSLSKCFRAAAGRAAASVTRFDGLPWSHGFAGTQLLPLSLWHIAIKMSCAYHDIVPL